MNQLNSSQPTGGRIRQQNEAIVLQAAEVEFAKHGFKGTSLQSIADRAELPKANVLYYFRSKEGLYQKLLLSIFEQWLVEFTPAVDEKDPAEVLGNYIRANLAIARDHPLRNKILAMEIMQGGPNLTDEFSAPYIEWSRAKVKVLERWVEQGKIKPISPAHLMFMIWGSTTFYSDNQHEVEMVLGQQISAQDFDDAEQTIVSVILRGLGIQD